MGNTVIAVYQADGDAEKAFRRLNAIYNSNYVKGALYGVVIDLPPSVCYSTASDERISETAKRCFDEISRGKKEGFFCALRPRRYLTDPKELKRYRSSYARFACEGGALGALSALTEIKRNGKEYFFAYFGSDSFSECDKLYFSGYDENGDKEVLPYPGTVNGSCEIFDGKRAVFPKITMGKKHFFDLREGLYPFEGGRGGRFERELGVGKSSVSLKGSNEPIEPSVRRLIDIAFHGIGEVYGKCEIKSVSDAALVMCAVTALRELRRLGNEEVFEISENVFSKLKELFFSGSGKSAECETAFLLTVLCGAYSKLSHEYPELHFLKNDVRELVSILLPHVENVKGYGFLCSREYCDPRGTDKLSFIARTIIWGADSDGLNAFLKLRADNFSEDIRAMASVLVYAAANAFSEYTSFLPELEYKIRYLRSKRGADALNEYESVYREPFFFGSREITYMRGFYPLRQRFAERGCDISLLPFAAYLEDCRDCQKAHGDKKYTLTLFADSAYPLVTLLLRASAIDPNVSICVVTKDVYSHGALKKVSSGRARLLTHGECSVKEMRKLSAVVRQITPYTVLGELSNEIRNAVRN